VTNETCVARCSSKDDPRYRAIPGVLRQFIRRNYLRKRLWRRILVHSPHNTARVMNAHSNPISAQAPFIVPFSRDNSFVSREELLADIDVTKKRISLHRRAALVGLGGVGGSDLRFPGGSGQTGL
jgi:hypothetical protein